MTEPEDWMAVSAKPPVELHTDRPHAARVYDVLLGGKTNYPADRKAAEQTLAALPNAATTARQNRAFMQWAARYLAAEADVRQFPDIGTGIPTSPNLHEVVQAVDPWARIVPAAEARLTVVRPVAGGTTSPAGGERAGHTPRYRPASDDGCSR